MTNQIGPSRREFLAKLAEEAVKYTLVTSGVAALIGGYNFLSANNRANTQSQTPYEYEIETLVAQAATLKSNETPFNTFGTVGIIETYVDYHRKRQHVWGILNNTDYTVSVPFAVFDVNGTFFIDDNLIPKKGDTVILASACIGAVKPRNWNYVFNLSTNNPAFRYLIVPAQPLHDLITQQHKTTSLPMVNGQPIVIYADNIFKTEKNK